MRLGYALHGDGRWHVHRRNCGDMQRAVRKLEYGQRPEFFDADGAEEIIAYLIDEEMEELGFGPDDVKIFACALTRGE